MPTLYPPEYPYRPDAPLLSFGPSFSEEIAGSVLRATCREDDDQPDENEIRAAASLTMLEGFHPRDHLECMMAAQGVTLHWAEMDSLARAIRPGLSDAMVIKWRASAALMNRSFLATARELERRQTKALPPRPPEAGAPPNAGAPSDPRTDPSPSGASRDTPSPAGWDTADPAPDTAGTKPRRERAGAKTAPPPAADQAVAAPQAPFPDLADVPEVPEDIETRPDGSPGSLTGYRSKQQARVVIPRIAPIMAALATRPGPYRLVNDPGSQIETATGLPRSPPNEHPGPDVAAPAVESPAPNGLAANRDRDVARGPLDVTERVFSGDSLSRFASARFDPDAPEPTPRFEDEDSVVELELISTGGDPEAEAHRAAMIAAHPEGKPIVVFRHGTLSAPADRADPRPVDRIGIAPPDT